MTQKKREKKAKENMAQKIRYFLKTIDSSREGPLIK